MPVGDSYVRHPINSPQNKLVKAFSLLLYKYMVSLASEVRTEEI